MTDRGSIFDTRWFAMSGRELLVLASAVALALVVIGAAAGLRALFLQPELTVEQNADMVPVPARIDINTATEAELCLLPGIGPKTAEAIIQHRRQHGHFPDLAALRNVRGLGPKTVERLRPHAMCAPPAQQSR